MQELRLGLNKLTSINDGQFTGLNSLQTLALVSNNISSFSKTALTGLTSLQKVCINSNPITSSSSLSSLCAGNPYCQVVSSGSC